MKKICYISLFCIMWFGVSLSMDDQELVLSTPTAHEKFIRSSLENAHGRVVLVSPFISSWQINGNSSDISDGLSGDIRKAIDRGVEVSVFVGSKLDESNPSAVNGVRILAELGADVKIVSGLHSKNLIVDNDCITFGSFNWLSAIIDPKGEFSHYETTTILRHEKVDQIISNIISDLIKLKVESHQGRLSSSLLGIAEKDQLDYAIDLYREHTTPLHYKELAEHNIGNYIYNCLDLREGLKVLREIEGVEGSEGTIIWAAYEILPHLCERASHFVTLAEILVSVKQPKKAAEIAENILSSNRTEEYDNFDSLWGRLNGIGLQEVGNKFEEYIYSGTWTASPKSKKIDEHAKEKSKDKGLSDLSDVAKALDSAATEPIEHKEKKYKKRLFVGEADFSYSVALIRKHPDIASSLTVTELGTKEDLEARYPETFLKNYNALKAIVSRIEFGVDASKIHEKYTGMPFPRIHFNFPHDGSNFKDRTLPGIIFNFFQSASQLQVPKDRIHVSLPKPQDGNLDKFYQSYVYDIYTASIKSNYKLLKKRKFSNKRYFGYVHRETKKSKSANVAEEGREYIFEKVSDSHELNSYNPRPHYISYDRQYHNALPEIDTDNDSSDYEDK